MNTADLNTQDAIVPEQDTLQIVGSEEDLVKDKEKLSQVDLVKRADENVAKSVTVKSAKP